MRWTIPFLMVLAGCQTVPPPAPVVTIQRVEVPVPVRCDPMLGEEPDYATPQEFAALQTPLDAVRLYKADRRLRIARDAEKTAALAACWGGTRP